MNAYEPIWAIGTGKTETHKQADEVCGHIRSVIGEMANDQVKESVTIQYGGSVKPSNINALLQTENINGALVGGASLEAESFKERSEEHTSELQSRGHLVCRLLLEKKKIR